MAAAEINGVLFDPRASMSDDCRRTILEGHKLYQLIENAARSPWTADAGVDWDLPLKTPFWLRRKTFIKVISQLYHGEIATRNMCLKLLGEVEGEEARRFVEMQIVDEERHIVVFERYLRRAGDIASIEEPLEVAFAQCLAWKGSHLALVAAFHIVLEGGVISILQHLQKKLPCPLMKSINAKLFPDEARHIAFGKIYLRQHLPALEPEERVEIYRALKKIWTAAAEMTRTHYTLPVALATRIGRDWLLETWDQQSRVLVDIGLVSDAERQTL